MTQSTPPPALTLLADIGGTNTRMATAKDGIIQTDTISRFVNAEFTSFDAVLAAYMAAKSNAPYAQAAIALAGPVQGGRAHMTNLNWVIEELSVAKMTGATKVLILNDLQAQGYALDELSPKDVTPILKGLPTNTNATRMVVGLGTGFNAVMVYHCNGLFVPPSESGHATLPYWGKEQSALARYVAKDGAVASIEDVLSGDGLANTYAFCAGLSGSAQAVPPSEVIAKASEGSDIAASQALSLFSQILGRVLSDLAICGLPLGGIYLVGGVARAITPFLTNPEFEQAFRAQGPMHELMENFSLSLISSDYAALSGGLTALKQSA